MAVSFTAASSEGLYCATPQVQHYPFTISCWFWVNSVTNDDSLVAFADTAGSYLWMSARGDNGDRLHLLHWDGAGAHSAFTVNTFIANTWYHALIVTADNSTRSVILNGDDANKGTNSNTVGSETFNEMTIGHVNNTGSRQRYMDGKIADVAVWNTNLTTEENTMLNEGVSPLLVRPNALTFYDPLIRDRRDIIGGKTYTEVGTPGVADHPRVIGAF